MKNNIKLIIGIALPILVVLFVVGSIALPKLFFNPKYDFIYTVDRPCGDYNCQYTYGNISWIPYKVVNGKISKETVFPKIVERIPPLNKNEVLEVTYPKLFRYHVDKDTFEEISLEEAQNLTLTDSGSAPDGMVVINDSRGSRGLIGEILGGGGSDYGMYLKKDSFSKRIIIQNGARQDYYYNSNFHLIGWVK